MQQFVELNFIDFYQPRVSSAGGISSQNFSTCKVVDSVKFLWFNFGTKFDLNLFQLVWTKDPIVLSAHPQGPTCLAFFT